MMNFGLVGIRVLLAITLVMLGIQALAKKTDSSF